MSTPHKHTPNEKIIHEGREIYLSRSVAVVILCGDIINNDVVVVQRGKSMDHAGQFCLPCGYLDYDETAEEAAVRELYEETGLVISPDRLKLLAVRSNPTKSEQQNVSILFACDYHDAETSDFHPDALEIEKVTWFRQLSPDDSLAFNHAEIIDSILSRSRESLAKFKNYVVETQQELDDQYKKIEEKSTLTEDGKGFLFDFIFNDHDTNNWADYLHRLGRSETEMRIPDKFNTPK